MYKRRKVCKDYIK